jgi:hypothetical protein
MGAIIARAGTGGSNGLNGAVLIDGTCGTSGGVLR